MSVWVRVVPLWPHKSEPGISWEMEALRGPNLPDSLTPCPLFLVQVSSDTLVLSPPTSSQVPTQFDHQDPHLLQGFCVICPTFSPRDRTHDYLTIIPEDNWVKIIIVPGRPQEQHRLI